MPKISSSPAPNYSSQKSLGQEEEITDKPDLMMCCGFCLQHDIAGLACCSFCVTTSYFYLWLYEASISHTQSWHCVDGLRGTSFLAGIIAHHTEFPGKLDFCSSCRCLLAGWSFELSGSSKATWRLLSISLVGSNYR